MGKTHCRKYLIAVVLILSSIFIVLYWPFFHDTCGFVGCHDTAFQLFPNLKYLALNLKNGQFPMWSFSIGLGSSYDITHISDITKLLISIGGAIFGIEFMPEISFILHALKTVFAGTIFFLYLKKLSLNDLASILGAILYAFSGIVIIRGPWIHYSTEVFLMALLLFALERYFQDRKYLLLIFSISFLFCHRGIYYVVLYSFLLLAYAVIRFYYIEGGNYQAFFRYIGRCFVIWGIAFLLSSVFILPNLVQTLISARGERTIKTFSNLMVTIFELPSWDRIVACFDTFFSPALNNTWNTSFYSPIGLDGPMFYCGILVVFLFPQAFFLADRKLRKIFFVISGIVLSYLVFPGVTYCFNLGIHEKYFKLSSLWIIVFMISVSSYCLDNIIKNGIKLNKKFLILEGIFLGIVYVYIEFIHEKYSTNTILYSAAIASVFFVLWFVVFYKQTINVNRNWGYIVLICAILEIIMSSAKVVYDGQYTFSNAIEKNMEHGYNGSYLKAIDYIRSKEDANNFYRIAKDFYISSDMVYGGGEFPSEALFYNYSGLEYLDSYAAKENIDFYKNMGIKIGKNRVWFPQNRQLLERFLGVKYYISNEKLSKNYEQIEQFDDYCIGINRYNLPFGFTYSNLITEEEFDLLDNDEKDIMLYYAYVWGGGQITVYNMKKLVLKC